MKTIEERAREYADVHKATEFNYFGVGQVYGYERIYNAEITAYERGAKEQKAIDEEVRLKKSDDMTKAEYEREVAFADWYHQNGKGTPTYSDAIEWTRRELIDKACKIVRNIINEYFRDGEQSCKVEDTFRKAMKE